MYNYGSVATNLDTKEHFKGDTVKVSKEAKRSAQRAAKIEEMKKGIWRVDRKLGISISKLL